MDVFIHDETGLRWSDSVIELALVLLLCGSVVKPGVYGFDKSENSAVIFSAISQNPRSPVPG